MCFFSARKKIESSVPIVRKDADIINLRSRELQQVKNVLDIFIYAKTSVHILRAVEPTLRFGINLDKFLQRFDDRPLPKCEYLNTTLDWRCVDMASRKQLGEALAAIDDRE